MWMFVWWWFSGFISYDDNIRGVALGYFLASLLTHTLLYQKTLLTKQQTPVDELKTQAAHKA